MPSDATPPRGKRIGEAGHLTPEAAGEHRWQAHREAILERFPKAAGEGE